MLKKLRIIFLFLILVFVATGALLTQQRLTDWEEPLWLVVYPIAGDTSPGTRRYIERLQRDSFAAIEAFMAEQARDYRKRLARPVKIVPGPVIDALPPEPPEAGSVLAAIAWSLRLRFWAWQHASPERLADVSMFVIYHDPELSPRVPISVGLKEGSIGVVHAFAVNDMTQSNNVIIAHEFLHTLGATDKYDLETNLPFHPDGYAEPQLQPRHPQSYAEIMGGRIPLAPDRALIPQGLQQVVIGPATAAEIGW